MAEQDENYQRREIIAEKITISLAKRKRLERRQSVLVANTGIAQSRLSLIMNAKTKARRDELEKLAEALGEPPDYFDVAKSPDEAPSYLTEETSVQPGAGLSLGQELVELGVKRNKFFEEGGFFESDRFRVCIGEVISIDSLGGLETLSIEETERSAFYPKYVASKMPECLETLRRKQEANRDKVAVVSWERNILDAKGQGASFTVAFSKYHKNRATMLCIPKILKDLQAQRFYVFKETVIEPDVSVPELACNLNCDAIIITKDRRAILGQRGRGVDASQGSWGVSVGEGMDWCKDKLRDDRDKEWLRAELTIRRAMREELGIPAGLCEGARITFLEYAFSLSNFVKFVIAVAEMPLVDSATILDAMPDRPDGEIERASSMEFSPRACASAIVTGYVDDKRIVDAGRLSLLVAARRFFFADLRRELALLRGAKGRSR